MARSTLDDFVLRDKIGSGSYGTVWRVIRKVDRQTYALKEIELQGMTRQEQEECIRETQVLSSLDSEYIIKYYDSFLEKGKLFIVTEFASGGSLHDLIKRQDGKMPEQMIWRLFIQMLLGLHHMHSKKILHRDFKALNIFLDSQLNVKLGDMGVAKILSTHTNFAQTVVGTPYYLSPELCEDKPYNEKSDVWALGVCLYECCTKRHPFDADNQGALILKILRGKYPPVTGYSKELVEVVKACLTLDVRKRPDSERLLSIRALRDRAAELGLALPPVHSVAKAINLTLGLGPNPQTPASAAAATPAGVAAAGGASSSSSPIAAPAGVAGAMQRKGSSQLGGNAEKGGGSAAAANGGGNGSGSCSSNTIKAVPSQKAVQQRPRTPGSKVGKDAVDGLQVIGGALSPRQRRGSSSSPCVTPSGGSVTGKACPSPRSGSSFTSIQQSPRGAAASVAAPAAGGGGAGGGDNVLPRARSSSFTACTQLSVKGVAASAAGGAGGGGGEGSVSPSPRSGNSFSSGRQQSPRMLPPLQGAPVAVVGDGCGCSSRSAGLSACAAEHGSCSKRPGSYSSSSSYLQKQQQLLEQGAGEAQEGAVGGLSSGLSQLGLYTEPLGEGFSMSQVYDDREDGGGEMDTFARALPALKEQVISMVGQKVFNALYLLMQMGSEHMDTCHADSTSPPREGSSGRSSGRPNSSSSSRNSAALGGGASPRGIGEQLQQAVVRILPPAEAPRVIALMFKLMYLEGRLAVAGVGS